MKERIFLFMTLCTTAVIKAENIMPNKGYETQFGTYVNGDNAKVLGVVINRNEANVCVNFATGTEAHLKYESVKITTL